MDTIANYDRRLTRPDAGVTLIEILIAAGVVAMALGSVFGALISINVMGQVAEGRARATMALAGVLERARGLERDALFNFDPNPIELEGMEIAVLLEAIDTSGAVVELPLAANAAQPDLANPFELRATALWTFGSERVYTNQTSTFHGS